jgi:L-fuconolactonase
VTTRREFVRRGGAFALAAAAAGFQEKRMRIDSHMHFWKYTTEEYGWIDDNMKALRRDFLPADAKKEIDAARIGGVVAVQARQTLEETRWLLELADQNHFIAGVVGWVDLQSPECKEQLQRFAAHKKLVGIRHIVQGEPDDRFLLKPEFGRGIALLEEFGLAYDILVFPRHLPVALEFVKQFPKQRFVLDHLAKPEIKASKIRDWERDLRALAEAPNVHCKLSGLVTEADWKGWTPSQLERYIDVAWEAFGAERLMVGSDWPVCTVAGSYVRVMGVFQQFLSDQKASDQEALLGDNAMKFYRLHRP